LALKRGDFREDLYYRLNVIDIRIPPLRDRREEIPVLAARFLASFNQQYRKSKTLSSQMVGQLVNYEWPGNVRELENVIRRFVVLRSAEQPLDLRPGGHSASNTPSVAIEEGLREIARNGARETERRALEEVLKLTRWNRAQAARTLKVSYKTLLNKIAECGLKYPDARHSLDPRQPDSR
jgi:two-component system, NtrC family, response regulator AtoC